MKLSPSPATKSAGMNVEPAFSMGFSRNMSRPDLFWMVDLSTLRAALTSTPGLRPKTKFTATSRASWWRSAKGLSNISAAMDGSRCPCRRAVAAPMERPHSATVETRPLARRKSMTQRASSFSFHPKVIVSPSDMPHPAKSNAKSVTPISTIISRCSIASMRQDELPCMYTTQGRCCPLDEESSDGCHQLHSSMRPLSFSTRTSSRMHRRRRVSNDRGPRCCRPYSARGGRMTMLTSSP
mmetsp:Transcript_74567/g.201729  ORF Transcript_74567/g.201729 Transcript_74567/m.201729 type:complete len:239 (-) Transcript_74567:198-914(-)